MKIIRKFSEKLFRGRKNNKPTTAMFLGESDKNHSNPVDAYWETFTVQALPFRSAQESLEYLEWRFAQYPLFREFMQLYGQHNDQIIVDYGCGPGNDLVGFLVHTDARKVIGIDVSSRALKIAARRLALHGIAPERIELIRTTDSSRRIPLDDNSVDYIYCEGVLHHTSYPEAILEEFRRALKPASEACIMVYNRDSLWLHLHTAYIKMVLERVFQGLSVEQVFAKTTDTEGCPVARCYAPEEFLTLCTEAGFHAEYVGGYLSMHELKILKEIGHRAVADERLGEEHRRFLGALEVDEKGYPMYRGKHAGIGGVYRLKKV